MVQGLQTSRRASLRFLAVLAIAHLATAGLVVAVSYGVGSLVFSQLPAQVGTTLVLMALGLAVAFDIRAIAHRGYSIGLHRQTAKGLAHSESRPSWVTALFWGLDTGLIWSTFRVSAASWVLIVAAVCGVVPQYGGLLYGAAFALSLTLVVISPERSDDGRPLSGPWVQLVQAGAVIFMIAMIAMVGLESA